MADSRLCDGVHSMVPRERMAPSARKLRDAYARIPGAPLVQRDHGYFCLDEWAKQGMPQGVPHEELFFFDPPGSHGLGGATGAGGCDAAFEPEFEVKVLEDRGKYEVEQDFAGRHVLYFKGRRNGFMPEYLDHPVKDMKTWQENVKWRLDPTSPKRYVGLEERMRAAQADAARGLMIGQAVVGGYMYLRSLIGPMNLLYAFYDMPDVVHDCMQAWLDVADAVIAHHQHYVTIERIGFDEDICYKSGALISPNMIREFLFPYYQQLISNIRSRQLDRERHLFISLGTDGYVVPIIRLYQEQVGVDCMGPMEVAAGNDVVQIGRQFPELIISGGIDKRVLASGRKAIDEHLEYILPQMRARGGYIPTCDHGVPAEVPYEDYLYYRKRCVELGNH